MPSPPFESLHSALLRVGVSPRYVRRYCAELSDHYHVAVEENRSAGLTPEEATADACRQLGDEGTLFRSVGQQPAVFAFARRRSGITFLLLPIPALYATKTLIVLISVLAGLLASRCAVLSIGWMNLFRPIAHLALDYGAPLAVAILFCMLAHRRGCRPFWPLLSALLIGFVAGCVQFEMRRSVLDVGFAHAGVGVVSFAVTPVLMVPPLVYVVFQAFRRHEEAASTAWLRSLRKSSQAVRVQAAHGQQPAKIGRIRQNRNHD